MPGHSDPTASHDILWSTLTSSIQACLSYLPVYKPLSHEHHASPFAERFKYDIISSSLLATTADFAPLRPGSSMGSPGFPGGLGHSRGSSVAQDPNYEAQAAHGQQLIDKHAPREQGYMDFKPLAALGLVLVILSVGYHILAVLTLLGGGAIFLVLNNQPTHHSFTEQPEDARPEEDKVTPTMNALHELIEAGGTWDAIVHSTIALLESEESGPSSSFSSAFPSVPHTSVLPSFPHSTRSPIGPAAAPPSFIRTQSSPTKLSVSLSPASLALRSALQSALSTTHAHCDSVRALLSALTLPGELAQMAEMYAPPSPGPSRFLTARDSPSTANHVFGGSLGAASRPLSLPGSKFSTPNRDRERRVKRSTWDGHVGTVPNGSPSPNVTLRKRRAGRKAGDIMSLDLSSLEAEQTLGEPTKGEEEVPFGPAALGLHRTRKTSGLSQLLSPADFPPSTPPRKATTAPTTPPSMLSIHAASYTPYLPRTPFAGGSTTYGGRHHLSIGALHTALAGALASKRFACAHLLALRFDEEDMTASSPTSRSHCSRTHSRRTSRGQSAPDDRDEEEEKEKEREAYWEDVRSVMSLLASTLSDTAASLIQAFEEAEEQRRRDGNPTPRSEGYSSLPRALADLDASFSMNGDSDMGDDLFNSPKEARTRLILDVLNMDNRHGEGEADGFAPAPSRLSRFAAHVGAIQAALDGAKEDLNDCVAAVRKSTVGSGAEPAESGEEDGNAVEEAMVAYERLRRELGLALRECERGREKLAELIAPRPSLTPEEEEEEQEGEGEGVPSLAEDSDRSDKHDSVGMHTRTPTVEFHTEPLIAAPDTQYPDEDGAVPPMGAEHVYEAEPEPAVTFNRERSKLTREERIRLAKAKRDSGLSILDFQEPEQNVTNQEGGRTGPGMDVVQELKDVIWQVGERRRKHAEAEL